MLRIGGPFLLVCAVVFSTPAIVRGADDQLTVDERKQLERGELVVRPTTERRGRLDLIGGTSWQLIDAKPDVVWEALLDTQYYHRMLPQVREAKLVADHRDVRTVYLTHGFGLLRASYHLKVKLKETDREIWFAMDDTKPHQLEAAWGFYSVRPYRGGRTLLTYGVMADLGEGVLRSVVKGTVHEWILRVPWMVKRFVEGSGRWIYKSRPEG